MNTPTRTTFTPGETVTKKHPIRGFFWGLLFGVGLAVVAVVTGSVTLSLTTAIAIVGVGVVVGILWGTVAPARAPKGPAPALRTAVGYEATRFDDFDSLSREALGGGDRETGDGTSNQAGPGTRDDETSPPTGDPGDGDSDDSDGDGGGSDGGGDD